MKFLLYLIARILAVALLPVGFIYAMFKSGRGAYFYLMALSIDQLGNVGLSRLFNDVLIKPSRDRFGNEDETISSVLGKNKLNGTLRPLGRLLVWILDKLDKNHSVKSIENV